MSRLRLFLEESERYVSMEFIGLEEIGVARQVGGVQHKVCKDCGIATLSFPPLSLQKNKR